MIVGPFVTLSNIVSVLRLVLTVPIAWLMWSGQVWPTFWLCCFAAFTDWLDGYIARTTNTESEWGRILDPLADKLLVGTVVVILLLQNRLPVWYVVVVLSRDVAIILGGVLASRYTASTLPSLLSGKLAVNAIAITGLAALLDVQPVVLVFMIISTFLMALSLWQYGKRLYGIIR